MAPVVELCSRRGFVFPGSSLYGGLASTFDYGPLGAQLKKNILDAWWRDFVELRPECVGLDTPIVLHPDVWRTSGHVDEFTDPLVQCNECNHRSRADKLLEDTHGIPPETVAAMMQGPDGESRLGAELTRVGAQCPACGSTDLAEPVSFNLLFRTSLGAAGVAPGGSGSASSAAYLRPETAQGAYINFANVIASTSRKRLPIGVGQVGKAFRNEISPGKAFLFRTREFELLELQWFYEGGDAAETEKWYRFWVDTCLKWLDDHGIDPAMVRAREHHADELAHYAGATTDIEFCFPGLGWGELWGIADRGSFDLEQHIEATRPNDASAAGTGHSSAAPGDRAGEKTMGEKKKKKKKKKTPKHPLEYVNPDDNAGLRIVNARLNLHRHDTQQLPVLGNANETLPDNGGERVVLKLHLRLAPIKVAVLPLVKNKPALVERSEAIHARLSSIFHASSANGSIGPVPRQDEIGTQSV